jgi:hypothetical protein
MSNIEVPANKRELVRVNINTRYIPRYRIGVDVLFHSMTGRRFDWHVLSYQSIPELIHSYQAKRKTVHLG